jgi:hypothetical protein
MNPVEIAALDALDLLVVVDNESDTLSSVDTGVPQLPELGRLVARVPHLAPKDGHDCVEPWGHPRVGSASGSRPSKPCASRTGTRTTAAGSRGWWLSSLGPA